MAGGVYDEFKKIRAEVTLSQLARTIRKTRIEEQSKGIEKVAFPHAVLAYNDDVAAERNVEIFEISEIAYGDACELHFHILDGDAVAKWRRLKNLGPWTMQADKLAYLSPAPQNMGNTANSKESWLDRLRVPAAFAM